MTFYDYDSNKYNQTNYASDEYSIVKNSPRRKKMERFVRKKRKKVNALKSFLNFLVVVFIVALSYYLITLPQWYLPSDFYKNPNGKIEVVNNKIIPDEVVLKAIKDVKVSKMPIFLVNTKSILHEIYMIPVVKKVYIRRYGFPARLQIIFRERTPIAIIKTNLKDKPIAFYSSDGVLVQNNSKYMDLPEKNILKILTTKNGLKKELTVKKIKELEEIVKEVETYSDEKVEYIDIRKTNDVFVKIKTTNIRLGVLDSSVSERIKRLYTILPQLPDNYGEIRYIDLSWDKVNFLKLKDKEK